MGATSLHKSMSSEATKTMISGITETWQSNIFLSHVFEWFQKPPTGDIDGDGHYTIMDSQKFASAMTNLHINAARNLIFKEIMNLQNQINATTPPSFDFESERDRLLGIMNIHQESWILNAIPAQQITI